MLVGIGYDQRPCYRTFERIFDGVGHGLWKANPAVPDCTMIDWDDVRYFLAVARGGSVRAAAERLGVNHCVLQKTMEGGVMT